MYMITQSTHVHAPKGSIFWGSTVTGSELDTAVVWSQNAKTSKALGCGSTRWKLICETKHDMLTDDQSLWSRSIPFSDTKIRWFLDIKELILALWARHGHGAARRTDCAEMRRWRAGCFVLVQRKRRELAPVGWWWYQRQRIEQSKKKSRFQASSEAFPFLVCCTKSLDTAPCFRTR